MWFRKKQKQPPEKQKQLPSPERVYQVTREFERLLNLNDEEEFLRFGMEHFEELSEGDRKPFLMAVYEDMRKRGLQIEAEQLVYDRLECFSEGVSREIEREVWGRLIDAYANKGVWKTGRRDRPSSLSARPIGQWQVGNKDRPPQHIVRSAPSYPEVDVEVPADIAYDVFISHATEDKDVVVRPLARELIAQGLRVWYDEFELRIGDSLRRKIDAGLAQSRFGVVVLSQAFLAKNWPQYELDGLVTAEIAGKQVILPLWHRITKHQLIERCPSLADKVARSTAELTIEEIAAEIATVIRSRR